MTWSVSIYGHAETEAEEDEIAYNLQQAAREGNATGFSFGNGSGKHYNLDSEIPHDVANPSPAVDVTTPAPDSSTVDVSNTTQEVESTTENANEPTEETSNPPRLGGEPSSTS